MKIRVKVEYPEGKSNYAYATTEHAASNRGIPVIAIAGEPYGTADLAMRNATVVTADKQLAATLAKVGYVVRISDPQKDYQAKSIRTASARISVAQYDRLAKQCAEDGISIHAFLKKLILDSLR